MHPRLDRTLVSDLPLFGQMQPGELDDVLAEARSQHYRKGDVVFTQGGDAHSFFVLLHGRLRVTQTTASGEQIVVRFVGPGDIFGVAMALRRSDYPGTATAIVDGLALVWPSSVWPRLIAGHPAIAANALMTVGSRLQEAHTRSGRQRVVLRDRARLSALAEGEA